MAEDATGVPNGEKYPTRARQAVLLFTLYVELLFAYDRRIPTTAGRALTIQRETM